MLSKVSIFWFRRDLRLNDNTGLYHALLENEAVLPLFIFDKKILDNLEDVYDRRVDFIHQAITSISEQLNKIGSSMITCHAEPLEAFKQLIDTYTIKTVYTNHDYEPYARERDEQIKQFLNSIGIDFKTFKDQTIFEKDEVVKDDGKPYTVFTPYSKKWKNKLNAGHTASYSTADYFNNFLKQNTTTLPTLKSLGFEKTDIQLNNSAQILNENLIRGYKENRDYPGTNGTSRLSVYLRFGVVSIRELARKASQLSESWLNELIWRDFYMMILWHFPHIEKSCFKPAYNNIPWRNDEDLFKAWCEGKTGFPIVDAGMRELSATGFMHNRVRMIVSSFLIKDLLINWQWGEAHFAKKLNDFDLSANNGGWQWAAGSGCDAAPYFRVFNPTEQQKKFDPQFIYIKKWVPEFGTDKYPTPVVDHAQARLRTLAVYKKALIESRQAELF